MSVVLPGGGRRGLCSSRIEGLNGVEELLRADRLGNVFIHAGEQAELAVALEGVGGHGNDRHVPAVQPLASADGQGGLQAVHFRHLHVHQHEVELLVSHGGHRLPAIAGNRHLVAVRGQQGHGQLLVDQAVLRQQDFQGPKTLRTGRFRSP